MWNPESGKFLLRNSESWALEYGIQLKESGILLTIRIRNRQVPLTKYSVGIQYLESEIHGLESRIQDCLGFPYMGWERARQLFATFSVVISASQEILFIIQMTISTLLILAVRRTHVMHEPCIWPSSPFVAQWLEHPTGSITGGDSYSFLSHVCDIRALGNSRFQYFSIR